MCSTCLVINKRVNYEMLLKKLYGDRLISAVINRATKDFFDDDPTDRHERPDNEDAESARLLSTFHHVVLKGS